MSGPTVPGTYRSVPQVGTGTFPDSRENRRRRRRRLGLVHGPRCIFTTGPSVEVSVRVRTRLTGQG